MLAACSAAAVGCKHNDLSSKSAKRVSIGGDVEMDMIVRPKTASCFLGSQTLLDKREDIARGGVAAAPQILAVRWIVTPSIGLFGTSVKNGNTTGKQGESKCVFENRPVRVDI